MRIKEKFWIAVNADCFQQMSSTVNSLNNIKKLIIVIYKKLLSVV